MKKKIHFNTFSFLSISSADSVGVGGHLKFGFSSVFGPSRTTSKLSPPGLTLESPSWTVDVCFSISGIVCPIPQMISLKVDILLL